MDIKGSTAKAPCAAQAWLRTGLWLALIGVSVAVLFPRMDQNAFIDFGAYWSAAQLLVRGENPYDHDLLLHAEREIGWDIAQPVIPWNPPWALATVIPLVLLPFRYASWVWLLLNCVLIVALADYLWRRYGGRRDYRMVAWLASLWFFPCIVAVYFGQMTVLVLAGVTGVLASAKNESKWFGFFLFLMSLKPHLFLPFWIILALWLICGRRLRMFLWGASAIAIAILVTLCLRPEVYLDYYRAAMSHNGPVIWATPTLSTALRVAFPASGAWPVLLPGVAGAALAVTLWKKWRSDFSWECHLNQLLLISIVTASYAWSFDWAVLLPSVIQILVWFASNPARGWPFLSGLAIILFCYALANARGLFPLGVVWVPGSLLFVYEAARRRLALPETVDFIGRERATDFTDSISHGAKTR